MTVLKRRLEKLEKFIPEINPISHLTDEELQRQLKLVQKRVDDSDCPNCKDCATHRECKELMDKSKEIDERMGFL